MVANSDKGLKIDFSWLQSVRPVFDEMSSVGSGVRLSPDMRRYSAKLHMVTAYMIDTNLLDPLHKDQRKPSSAFDREKLAKSISESYLLAAKDFAGVAENSQPLDLDADTLRTVDNAIGAVVYRLYEAEQLVLSRHGAEVLKLPSDQQAPIDIDVLTEDIRQITLQIIKICLDFKPQIQLFLNSSHRESDGKTPSHLIEFEKKADVYDCIEQIYNSQSL